MKASMKESFGDITKLRELGKNKKNDFTTEQLLDENLKNLGGESRKEVYLRINKAFNRVLSENKGKNIVIVGHGAALKFLLMNWCDLNSNNQLQFKNNIITLNSPGVVKLEFEGNKLIRLTKIV